MPLSPYLDSLTKMQIELSEIQKIEHRPSRFLKTLETYEKYKHNPELSKFFMNNNLYNLTRDLDHVVKSDSSSFFPEIISKLSNFPELVNELRKDDETTGSKSEGLKEIERRIGAHKKTQKPGGTDTSTVSRFSDPAAAATSSPATTTRVTNTRQPAGAPAAASTTTRPATSGGIPVPPMVPARTGATAPASAPPTPRTQALRSEGGDLQEQIRAQHARELQEHSRSPEDDETYYPVPPRFQQEIDTETGQQENLAHAMQRDSYDLLRGELERPQVSNPSPKTAPPHPLEQMALPRIMELINKSAELTDEERGLMREFEKLYSSSVAPSAGETHVKELTDKHENLADLIGKEANQLIEGADQQTMEATRPITAQELEEKSKVYGENLANRIRRKTLDRYTYDKQERDKDFRKKMLAMYKNNWNHGGRMEAERDYDERERRNRIDLEESIMDLEAKLGREGIALALGQAQREREMNMQAGVSKAGHAQSKLKEGEFAQNAFINAANASQSHQQMQRDRRADAMGALEAKNATRTGQLSRHIGSLDVARKLGSQYRSEEQQKYDRELGAQQNADQQRMAMVSGVANFANHVPVMVPPIQPVLSAQRPAQYTPSDLAPLPAPPANNMVSDIMGAGMQAFGTARKLQSQFAGQR